MKKASLIRYFDVAGRPGRFPGLDNLRAIAIVLVLLRHAVHFWDQPFDGYFWNLWYNGWLGVDLFFTLSGFLITYHLLSKWPERDTKKYIYHYFAKRGLRILPLYIFVLTIAGLDVIPYFEPDNMITLYALLVHTVFLQDYIPYASIVVPLWSLGVEEKFYLLAPVLVYFTRRYKPLHILAGSTLLILFMTIGRSLALGSAAAPTSYAEFFWNYRAPFHFSVMGILCGAIMALLYYKFKSNLLSPGWGKTLQYLSLFLLAVLLSATPWVEAKHWGATGLVIAVSSVCFSFILYRSLSATPKSDGPLAKVLRFLAKLAYPLYLSHLLVLPLAKRCCLELSGEGAMRFPLFFIIFILLSLFASLVIHLAVEKPFLILKDRF